MVNYWKYDIVSMRRLNNWSIIYLGTTLLIHSTMIIYSVYVVTQHRRLINLPWVFLSVVWWLPIAEKFAQVSTYLFIKLFGRKDIYSLTQLKQSPKVALLYCTKDDAVSHALDQLDSQDYVNTMIFVLDDSIEIDSQLFLEQYPYQIVRRDNHRGNKAGNINHWLKLYGHEYDYFVVLDSDSILPRDFVSRMLLYGEHPDNGHIAMFESKIQAWQPQNRLQHSENVQMLIAGEISHNLLNKMHCVLSNGHNNFCRTDSILAVSGFDERFIGEDHATTLNLYANGMQCYTVDVESYEISPPTLAAYKSRHERWVRNDLQLLTHEWQNVPIVLQFRLLFSSIQYVISLLAIPLMIYAVWGTLSDIPMMQSFFHFVIEYPTYRASIMVIYVLMMIFVIYLFFLPLPIALNVSISLSQYASAIAVSASLGMILLFTTIRSVVLSFLPIRHNRFVVTSKVTYRETLLTFISSHFLLVLLIVIIGIGLIRNPMSILFNWIWIVPLILSPFILFKAQENRS